MKRQQTGMTNETTTFLRDHEKDTKWEYFDD